MYLRIVLTWVSWVALRNAAACGGKSMCLQNVWYTLTFEAAPVTASIGLAIADAMIASNSDMALVALELRWPVCVRGAGTIG